MAQLTITVPAGVLNVSHHIEPEFYSEGKVVMEDVAMSNMTPEAHAGHILYLATQKPTLLHTIMIRRRAKAFALKAKMTKANAARKAKMTKAKTTKAKTTKAQKAKTTKAKTTKAQKAKTTKANAARKRPSSAAASADLEGDQCRESDFRPGSTIA